MNVYLLADYGSDDLAWAEVEAALRGHVDNCQSISRVAVPAFDTWALSLALFQIHHQTGRDDIVFHNVAPRKDDPSPRENNEGEPLCAGWSDRGTLFLGPDSGQSWSLVAPLLHSLREVRCSSGGSQFRSRDVFPQTIPLIIAEVPGIFAAEGRVVPEMPSGRVLLIDGYGNIKTSLDGDYPVGSSVQVSIGGKSATAQVSEGAFGVAEGQMALSRGSSGGMWEVFVRGGSAGAMFDFPPGGSEVSVE